MLSTLVITVTLIRLTAAETSKAGHKAEAPKAAGHKAEKSGAKAEKSEAKEEDRAKSADCGCKYF